MSKLQNLHLRDALAIIGVTIIALFVVDNLVLLKRVQNNTNSIKVHEIEADKQSLQRDQQQAEDIATINYLEYQACVRINDTRGVTLIRLKAIPGGGKALASDLPLYRCSEKISRNSPRLTQKEVTAYLETLVKGKAPGP